MNPPANIQLYYTATALLLLPVITVAIVFVRRLFQPVFVLLIVACVLHATMQLWWLTHSGDGIGSRDLFYAISLAEWMLYFFIVRQSLPANLRPAVPLLMIAFISAILTAGITNQLTGVFGYTLPLAQLLLCIAGVLALLSLYRKNSIQLLQSPAPFLITGMMFYAITFLLIKFIQVSFNQTKGNYADKRLLVAIADVVRFLFFIVATNIPSGIQKNDKTVVG